MCLMHGQFQPLVLPGEIPSASGLRGIVFVLPFGNAAGSPHSSCWDRPRLRSTDISCAQLQAPPLLRGSQWMTPNDEISYSEQHPPTVLSKSATRSTAHKSAQKFCAPLGFGRVPRERTPRMPTFPPQSWIPDAAVFLLDEQCPFASWPTPSISGQDFPKLGLMVTGRLHWQGLYSAALCAPTRDAAFVRPSNIKAGKFCKMGSPTSPVSPLFA